MWKEMEVPAPRDVWKRYGTSSYATRTDTDTGRVMVRLHDGTMFDSDSDLLDRSLRGVTDRIENEHLDEGMSVVDHLRALEPDLFAASDRRRLDALAKAGEAVFDVTVYMSEPR